MKTTIDIPEELYKSAKIRAVEQGTSLKDLMLKALRNELQPSVVREQPAPYFARRVMTPAFRALMESGALKPKPGERDVTDLISEDRDAR